MKNFFKLLGTLSLRSLSVIALSLIIVFTLSACSSTDSQPASTKYEWSAGGNKYDLTITEISSRSAIRSGNYVLHVTDSAGVVRKSEGTAAAGSGDKIIFTPNYAGAAVFEITITGSGNTTTAVILAGAVITFETGDPLVITEETSGGGTGGDNGGGDNGGGSINEIEGGTIISGYWYLDPKNFDTGVFSYDVRAEVLPSYNNMPSGHIGGVNNAVYKQLIASDNSYEKLIAYKWFGDTWFCTLKYKLTENPLVIEILDVELAQGEEFKVDSVNTNLIGKLLYKGKYMDGTVVEEWWD